MVEVTERTNYQIAKEESDKIDAQIIDILQQGKNFRVEAGAGSGKTYSLNKVIEWIQDNKWNRNLFYVCCSRPKKRLFLFVSVPVDDIFRDFLSGLVGDSNILTYEQYISQDWKNK